MVNLHIISVFLAIMADIKNYIISRPLRKVLCWYFYSIPQRTLQVSMGFFYSLWLCEIGPYIEPRPGLSSWQVYATTVCITIDPPSLYRTNFLQKCTLTRQNFFLFLAIWFLPSPHICVAVIFLVEHWNWWGKKTLYEDESSLSFLILWRMFSQNFLHLFQSL